MIVAGGWDWLAAVADTAVELVSQGRTLPGIVESTASFDSGAESQLAAVTYTALLEPHLNTLPSRKSALDIGAGDGAFVEQLLAQGFVEVVGVEPSKAHGTTP